MGDTLGCTFLTAPKHKKKRVNVYTADIATPTNTQINTPSAFISTAPTKSKKSTKQDVMVPHIIPSININECDIFYIDNVIQAMLAQQIAYIPLLEQELSFLKNQQLTPKIQSQIAALRSKIRDIQSTIDLSYYLYKTSDILATFKKLSTHHFNCFIQVKTNENMELKNMQLSNIVSDYISIARNYVNIENYEKKPPIFGCPSCAVGGKENEVQKSSDDDSLFICMKCGMEIKILDNTPTFKDADRINMANRYTYSRRGHFIEAMKKFQGKHNIDPDTLLNVIAGIETEMAFHSLTKETVTKDNIYMFLSEKKLSNHYYDNINLIFHIITGKPCPEFSHLENTLLELFEEQEAALDQVMASEDATLAGAKESAINNRTNSINVYYKLYKLLQKVGFPCKKTDFYFLKTKNKEEEHDEVMRQAWIILRWPWIET